MQYLAIRFALLTALGAGQASANLVSFGGTGGSLGDKNKTQVAAVGTATVSSNYSTPTDSGQYAVETRYGVNKVSAISQLNTLQNGSNPGSTYAFADSEWRDTLAIIAPGLTNGFVTSTFHIEGSNAATSVNSPSLTSSTYYFSARLGSSDYTFQTKYSASGSIDQSVFGGYSETIISNGSSFSRIVTLKTAFTSGISFSITGRAICAARVRTDGASNCSADQSAYWGGVTSVTDTFGAPVASWSLLSGSGTDYSQSFVPEPASWGMLIIGFGLTGALARRARHATASIGSSTVF